MPTARARRGAPGACSAPRIIRNRRVGLPAKSWPRISSGRKPTLAGRGPASHNYCSFRETRRDHWAAREISDLDMHGTWAELSVCPKFVSKESGCVRAQTTRLDLCVRRRELPDGGVRFSRVTGLSWVRAIVSRGTMRGRRDYTPRGGHPMPRSSEGSRQEFKNLCQRDVSHSWQSVSRETLFLAAPNFPLVNIQIFR